MTLRSRPSLRRYAANRLIRTKSGIPEAKPVTTQMPIRLDQISRHTERCVVCASRSAPAPSSAPAPAAAALLAALDAAALL